MNYEIVTGTITRVIPPSSEDSLSKLQYEYDVLIVGKDYARIPLQHAVLKDDLADNDDYEFRVLRQGTKVIIALPKGDPYAPIILSALKMTEAHIPKITDGLIWERRFQEITNTINRFGEWVLTSDDGPNIKLEKQQIIVDDSAGQKIVWDKANKKMLVTAGEYEVVVSGNATINITGNVTLNCEKADVTANSDINATCQNLKVTANGEAEIKATKDTKVKGLFVKLNGEEGEVLTDRTQPACYVTGIPFIGSKRVRAGS